MGITSRLSIVLVLSSILVQPAIAQRARGVRDGSKWPAPASGRSAATAKLSMQQVGPGDPTTLFAVGLGAAWTAIAAPGNTYYVLDWDGRIMHVSSTGQVSVFATGIEEPYGMAIDGLGNILVTDNQLNGSVITRISPAGVKSQFASGLEYAIAVAIGPNGDVYAADPFAGVIHHYTSGGTELTSINLAGIEAAGLLDLAFSPSGALHFSDYTNSIYRVTNNVPVKVLTTSFGLGGVAFDRDGYMYTGSVETGIHLFNSSYQAVSSPFATIGLTLTGNVVFGRDDSGLMTNRLFGINVGDGTMVEVNRSAVRAPGFRVGVDALLIANTSLRNGIMGAAFADTLRVAVATPGAVWHVSSGALPPGVTLSTGGVVSGIPTTSGIFNFTALVEGDGRVGARPFALTVTRPQISASAASDHLLGVSGLLTADEQRFLDLQGNRNGRYDIGDLQAFLRPLTPQIITRAEKRPS
jgi:hypothetical protein